ncbi:prepilin-type N-terminal cleavage/methylation domain-containing protein [Prosthecobacter sp.]|uniref:prepilin-type N-terminal cleavage/methylation domain-containing protein n=1 Tax=Prosthecobacter sp. TaxID=1965333 RepID=UPI003784D632
MTNVRNIVNAAPAVPNAHRAVDSLRPARHSSSAGFTLLEIIVAMSLTLLIIAIAIPSISGVLAEDKLRRAAAMIETTARQNLLQALNTQQTVRMQLSAGSFGAGDEFGGMLLVRRYGESVFRKPRRGESWDFSPSGICEPIEVRISGPAGQIEIGFDPLTACARRKSIQVKG